MQALWTHGSHGLGGPENVTEARRLLELAAAQGLAVAQFGLGFMYQHGEGGPPDRAEAQRLYELAAAADELDRGAHGDTA
mgnify:CR=1 FL=1